MPFAAPNFFVRPIVQEPTVLPDPSLNPHCDLPISVWLLVGRGSCHPSMFWYATVFHRFEGFREVLGTAVSGR